MPDKNPERSAGENQRAREELERENRSSGKNEEKEFPGYPHYDSKDDITVQAKRETLDVENVSRSGEDKKRTSELNTGPELDESGKPEPQP